MRLRAGRGTVWFHRSLANMPIPRPVFFFEDCLLQLGGEFSDGNSDAVLHASFEVELPTPVANFLDRVLPR